MVIPVFVSCIGMGATHIALNPGSVFFINEDNIPLLESAAICENDSECALRLANYYRYYKSDVTNANIWTFRAAQLMDYSSAYNLRVMNLYGHENQIFSTNIDYTAKSQSANSYIKYMANKFNALNCSRGSTNDSCHPSWDCSFPEIHLEEYAIAPMLSVFFSRCDNNRIQQNPSIIILTSPSWNDQASNNKVANKCYALVAKSKKHITLIVIADYDYFSAHFGNSTLNEGKMISDIIAIQPLTHETRIFLVGTNLNKVRNIIDGMNAGIKNQIQLLGKESSAIAVEILPSSSIERNDGAKFSDVEDVEIHDKE